MPSELVAHVDCNKVTREQLALIPTPVGTDTFKPVPFIELVEGIDAVLHSRGISIQREDFAVRSDCNRLFGTFDLSLEGIEGTCGAMGLRSGNDRTMKLQMIFGARVFVCDNMAFSGGSIILNRKHTAKLDLLPELMGAVKRFEIGYEVFRKNMSELRTLALTEYEAKSMIYNVFHAQIMPIKYFRQVGDLYFGEHKEEYGRDTAYALHNCITEIAQDMFLNRRMLAMQAVGEMFGI
jgi:hypothetical protein